jgi:hypothetical protein
MVCVTIWSETVSMWTANIVSSSASAFGRISFSSASNSPPPPIFCWLFPCPLNYCNYCRKTLYTITFLCEHDLEIWRMVAVLSITAQEQGRNWPRWENGDSALARMDCSVSFGPTAALCFMNLVFMLKIPDSYQLSQTCPRWYFNMIHTDPLWFLETRWYRMAWYTVEQKSIGLKFSKSRTGSDVQYSCHHSLSCFTFPIVCFRRPLLARIQLPVLRLVTVRTERSIHP